jgi:hypothetical protein
MAPIYSLCKLVPAVIIAVFVVPRSSQNALNVSGPLPFNFNFTSTHATCFTIAHYSHTMNSTPSETCLCTVKIATILAKIAQALIQINVLHVVKITSAVQS